MGAPLVPRPPTGSCAPGPRRNGCQRDARTPGHRTQDLPVIWDADFLNGPRTAAGIDSYVLCEINDCAVWPFPPTAPSTIARAAFARVRSWKPAPGSDR
ncbi:hypothetical protein [Nostocoides sp. HKS02]|uniref:Cj0069 family protein n=1 Tax=Nostocoides sp. HKS02 TaxID=1813880 RepID=UPI00351B19FD